MNPPEAETVIQASKQCLTRLLPYITEPVTVDFVASYVVTGEMPGHAWKLPLRVICDPNVLARQLLMDIAVVEHCQGTKVDALAARGYRARSGAMNTCYEIRTWLTDNT